MKTEIDMIYELKMEKNSEINLTSESSGNGLANFFVSWYHDQTIGTKKAISAV
jgi:hypothetical protein